MPSSLSATCRSASLFLLAGIVLLVATSCRTAEAVVKLPGKTVQAVTSSGKEEPPPPVDPVAVQQDVLRFADQFTTQMNFGIDKLEKDGRPLERTEVLRWKIAFGTDVCTIASGPNAVANLLDLTVLVSVTRSAAEGNWSAGFGDSVQPLIAGCRSAETEVWRLAAKILNEQQQLELRQAIEAWQRENPHTENILAARALSFAAQLAPTEEDTREKSGSVFGLLRLDPLAGLDPATREIAQSRLLAERALFVTQKMPQLLRWQLELLSANALA